MRDIRAGLRLATYSQWDGCTLQRLVHIAKNGDFEMHLSLQLGLLMFDSE